MKRTLMTLMVVLTVAFVARGAMAKAWTDFPSSSIPSDVATSIAEIDSDGDGTPDIIDTDVDGDGVPNGDDNCSAVWNPPVGPIGEAVQLDNDADGVGNACDVCSNDADPSHQTASACFVDADSDTVDDHTDNCLGLANADQLDGDSDGVGNACDACADDADASHQDAAVCAVAADPDVDTNLDSDGDGVIDEEDVCPTDPEDACASSGQQNSVITPAGNIENAAFGGCSLAPAAQGNALSMLIFALGFVPLVFRRSK